MTFSLWPSSLSTSKGIRATATSAREADADAGRRLCAVGFRSLRACTHWHLDGGCRGHDHKRARPACPGDRHCASRPTSAPCREDPDVDENHPRSSVIGLCGGAHPSRRKADVFPWRPGDTAKTRFAAPADSCGYACCAGHTPLLRTRWADRVPMRSDAAPGRLLAVLPVQRRSH